MTAKSPLAHSRIRAAIATRSPGLAAKVGIIGTSRTGGRTIRGFTPDEWTGIIEPALTEAGYQAACFTIRGYAPFITVKHPDPTGRKG